MLDYFVKVALRNKKRTLFLTIGIVIAVTLITGINSSSTMLGVSIVNERISDNSVDIVVQSSGADVEKTLNTLDSISDEVEEYQGSFYSKGLTIYNSILSPGAQSINWSSYYYEYRSEYDNKTYGSYLLNTTAIFGLAGDIFQNNSATERFSELIAFKDGAYPDYEEKGIYLDSRTASDMGVDAGDFISLGIYFNIYDDYSGKNINFTLEINGLKVLGIYDVFDRNKLLSILMTGSSESYYGYGDFIEGIILAGNDYVKNITDYFTAQFSNISQSLGIGGAISDYFAFDEREYYGVFLDHQSFDLLNIERFKSRLEYIITRIRVAGTNNGIYLEISSPLEEILTTLSYMIFFYRLIFFLISTPVILLSWFLSKTSYDLSYQLRRREISLLKCKGALSGQILRGLIIESLLIGVIGAFLGILLGQLLSGLTVQRVLPESGALESLKGSLFNPSDIYTGLIIGVIISLLSVIKPVKSYSKISPVEGIREYHEEIQSNVPRKKIDYFLFIGSSLIFILAYMGIISLSSQNTTIQTGQSAVSNPILYMLMSMITPLLPIVPFILIYSTIKLITSSKEIFKKIVKAIASIFPEKYRILSSKTIMQQRVRSFRVLFIVSLSLSFMIMSSTMAASELEYQNELQIITTANGIPVYYYDFDNSHITNQSKIISQIKASSVGNKITDIALFVSYKDSSIKGFNGGGNDDDFVIFSNINRPGINNHDEHTLCQGEISKPIASNQTGGVLTGKDARSVYYGGHSLIGINPINLTGHVVFKKSWLYSGSWDEIFEQLKTNPNATVMPSDMAQYGYNIGDKITFTYRLANGTSAERVLTIVGIYSQFPIITGQYLNSFIINNNSITDASVESAYFVFYGTTSVSDDQNETEQNSELTYTEIEQAFKQIDGTSYIYNIRAHSEETYSILYAVVNFIDIEGYYLLVIVVFAIGFIMYLSITEKIREFAILRARGVPKKEIFKVQLIEASILIIFSLILSLLGLLGAHAFILNINSISVFGMGTIPRTVIVPWSKLLLEMFAALVLFIISVAVSVQIEMKKSDIGRIARILRV